MTLQIHVQKVSAHVNGGMSGPSKRAQTARVQNFRFFFKRKKKSALERMS